MNITTRYRFQALVSVFAGFCLLPAMAVAGELYFVDAHSQVDHKVDDLSLITTRMQENGVRKTILASRGHRSDEDIVRLAKDSSGKIIASIRTKGGKYTKDKDEYYSILKKQSRNGKFGAIAEVIMYHAQKGEKAKKVDILPSDNRVKAALKAAKKNGWPFVVHIEFAAVAKDSASRHQLYRKELGKMVEANPETPFVLIHMGQLSEKEAGEMLGKFKNLYLMTSHADPFTTEHSSQPWVNMYSNQSLTPAWQGLMKQYPDRFVFALDNVWADHWQHEYPKKVNLWRKALGELPPDVAKAVAHGNAERLWGLK